MTGPSPVTTLTGKGDVYFENGGDALCIGTLGNDSRTFYMDLDGDDGVSSDMLYIGEEPEAEQNLVVKNLAALDKQVEDGEAVRFATARNGRNAFRDGKTVSYTTNGIYRDAFKVDCRDVADDPQATDEYNKAYNGDTSDGIRKPTTADVASMYLSGENSQNVYLVKSIDSINDGAKTPAKSDEIVLRYVADLDTFTKRSGNTTYFTPGADQGGWIRFGYRNLGVDGIGKVNGNTYELGYTKVLDDKENYKHRFSLSGACGKESGSWEGLGGYDFTDSQGIHVSADHDWSLIGRVGFDLVDEMDKEKNTKLYLKASLLREFIDGYDVVAESLAQGGTVAGTYRTAAAAAGLGGSSVLVTARSLERTRPSMSMPNGMWATTLAGPTISVLELTGNSKSKKAERRGIPPFCFFQRREEGKLFFCKKYFKKGVAFYFIFAIIMTVPSGMV